MLSRFFKPKWQHHDPAVRRRAVEDLGDDDGDVVIQIVTELALNDPDVEVRCVALRRLTDVELLGRIGSEAKNPRVRERAGERRRDLFAGTEPGLDAGRRAELLQAIEDAALLEHVARHGCDAELRVLALKRVSRQPLLLELAAADAAIDVRLAALERIETSAHLQQLCKQSRGRDKRVYRLARQRLDERLRAEQRPKQIQQGYATLCTRAEALLKCNTPDAANAALQQLQQQWLALTQEAAPGDAYLSRFADAVAAIGEMELVWRQQAEDREHGALALNERLEALLAEARELELDKSRLDRLGAELASCEDGWRALKTVQDDDVQARYRELARSLRQLLQGAGVQLSALSRATAACERAEHMLAADKPVSGAALQQLERQWPQAGGAAAEALPGGRFKAALGALRERVARQADLARDKLDRAGKLVAELEQALEAGESRKAASLQQKVQQLEKDLRALGLELPSVVSQRLQRLAGRLRELRDWQRFSNTTEREQLCEQVEALIGADIKIPELAAQIKAARNSWNGLGSTDRDAIGALRDRFNQACEQAYKPCALFYEQQAQQRSANLAERSALCKRLQSFVDEADWSTLDINTADQVVREARDAWKAIGPVDRGGFKQVSGPYHAALDVLVGHVRKLREANLQRKQGLLAQAEALVSDEVELGRAMDGIRELQAQWRQVGPGPRRTEQQVWKRFQRAGDAVFARRNAQRDAIKKEQQAGVAEREVICDRLQTLLTGIDTVVDGEAPPEADDAALRAAARVIDADWSAAPALAPRSGGAVRNRYRELSAELDELLAGRAAVRRTGWLTLTGQAALLVAEAEAADESARAELEARWQALFDGHGHPTEANLSDKLLQARWRRALGGEATESAAAEAATLCLKMEIAAGIDSPPEVAAERMALQVERLNQGFGGGDDAGDTLSAVESLECDWWRLGRLPAEQAQPLTRRFVDARDAGYRAAGIPLK